MTREASKSKTRPQQGEKHPKTRPGLNKKTLTRVSTDDKRSIQEQDEATTRRLIIKKVAEGHLLR